MRMRYQASSMRNGNPETKFSPVVESCECFGKYQDRDDFTDNPDYPDLESGWVPQVRAWTGSSEFGYPNTCTVYATEGEAELRASEAMAGRFPYETLEAAHAVAQKQADDRLAAAKWRTALRKQLRAKWGELGGVEQLADLLGVQKKHTGNLAKFIEGKKPTVPGEKLQIISDALSA